MEERRSFLANKSLCFACYGENHNSRFCKNKRECKKCKKPHPTLLHVDGFSFNKANSPGSKEAIGQEKTPKKVNNARVNITQTSSHKDDILLQTILPDSRLRSEALLKFEGYNDVQITTLFLNWLPTVTSSATSSATVKLQSK